MEGNLDKRVCQYCFAPLKNVSGREVECEYCFEVNQIAAYDDEISSMLLKAGELCHSFKYSEAIRTYSQILRMEPNCIEALWCRLLADYGIQITRDDDKIVPTLKRLSDEPITAHKDYIQVMELCEKADDKKQAAMYAKFAERIEVIRKNAAAIVKNHNPCDIFICFKQSLLDGSGKTEDYDIGMKLYFSLKQLGRDVFFSPISLQGLAGQDYEPLIYHALSTAKVMILLGTKLDYINAEWVVNEWTRYLDIIKKDPRKAIIPCFGKEIDPYMLPDNLSRIQGLDVSDITFKDNVIASVNNILVKFTDDRKSKRNKKDIDLQEFKKVDELHQGFERRERQTLSSSVTAPSPKESNDLKRARQIFEQKNYKAAGKIYEQIVEKNDQCAEAWMGRAFCVSRMACNDLWLTDVGAEFFDKAMESTPDDKMPAFLKNAVSLISQSLSPECATKLFSWADDVVAPEVKAELGEYMFYESLRLIEGNANEEEKAHDDLILSTIVLRKHRTSLGKTEAIFDASCKAIPPEDVDLYLARNVKFGDTMRQKKLFKEARKYYQRALDAYEGCVEAKIGIFLSEYKCLSYNDPLFAKIILSVNVNKNKMVQLGINQNATFMEAVMNVILEAAKRGELGSTLKLFSDAIAYIPDEFDKYYTKVIRDMVFVLISNKKFKIAEKYTDVLLQEDSTDDVAYIANALISLKCTSLVELVLQNKPLLDIEDFDNALNCSDYANEVYTKLYNWQVYLSLSKKIRVDTEVSKKVIQAYRRNLQNSGIEGTELLAYNDVFFKQAVATGDFGEDIKYRQMLRALRAKR